MAAKESNEKIAVIMVRGFHDLNFEIKDTLKMLNILKRNVCVILPKTASILGMVAKVQNYVTYGEVNEETIALIKKQKGESKFYNLNSPRKGYGRKGIKTYFSNGGALGYRGDKINDLIKRML